MTGVLDAPREIMATSMDRLMPMHVRFDHHWKITHAAPTIRKVVGPSSLTGRLFFDEFSVGALAPERRQPAIEDLICKPTRIVAVRQPGIPMRGLIVPCMLGSGYLANLSFGVSVIEAIHRFGLNQSDFSPADLAIELMFLHEANQAAVAQWKNLAARLETAYGQAAEQSLTDPLTGLGNRRQFDARLEELVAAECGFSLLLLDLDQFKSINDAMGHEAGDLALVKLSEKITRSIRKTDQAFRLGGDEFVVLLPGMVDDAQMADIVRRLFAELGTPVDLPFGPQVVSASVGGASTSGHLRPDPGQILRDADQALYKSKHAGRGRFTAHGGETCMLLDGTVEPLGDGPTDLS